MTHSLKPRRPRVVPLSLLHDHFVSARQLSSTDWVGFDDIWEKRLGNIALKDALDHHRKFEEVGPL